MLPANAVVASPVGLPTDWQGASCIILGSGPSARGVSLGALPRGVRVVALNKSIELHPTADMLYACDARFWKTYQSAAAFRGYKVSAEAVEGVHRVSLRRDSGHISERMSFDVLGEIGGGYSSGFQALNLVAQLGCSRVLLCGFDASVANGAHWHGDHQPPLTNPTAALCKRWQSALDAAAPTLFAKGVSVSVIAPTSLQAYPITTVQEWVYASL